ncbi:MAG: hypothetical protein MK212_17630 [Saprospiraceae bacterium]|nr:hypothetical protein [Saprospiraceae bacterium]
MNIYMYTLLWYIFPRRDGLNGQQLKSLYSRLHEADHNKPNSEDLILELLNNELIYPINRTVGLAYSVLEIDDYILCLTPNGKQLFKQEREYFLAKLKALIEKG